MVNVPLPASGVPTEAFVALWAELLPAVARSVRPDLLVVSAGFDYVAGDSVGDLGVGIEAAAPVAATIGGVAREFCGGAVAYVLEGGYGIDALTQSIAAIARISDGALPSEHADRRAVPPEIRAQLQAFLRESQGSS